MKKTETSRMSLSFVFLCATLSVTSVFCGCVGEPFKVHKFLSDKELDQKEVELISKDLIYKLDHGLKEKELMEKTLDALKAHLLSHYSVAEKDIDPLHPLTKDVPLEEKHDLLRKNLFRLLGPNFKKEGFKEQELRTIEEFLKLVSKEEHRDTFLNSEIKGIETKLLHPDVPKVFDKPPSDGIFPLQADKSVFDAFLKNIQESRAGAAKEDEIKHLIDSLKMIYKEKLPEPPLKHGVPVIDGTIFPETPVFPDESDTHLAESVLHIKRDTDAEAFHLGEKEAIALMKKLEQAKLASVGATVPHFIDHGDVEGSFKGDKVDPKILEDDSKFLKEILKALLNADSASKASHSGGNVHFTKDADVVGFEGPAGVSKTAAMKDYSKEAISTHKKDHMYDELLKKAEFHPMEDIFEDKIESKDIAAEVEKEKTEEKKIAESLNKMKKEEDIFKSEKDKSIDEILKEDGYFITKGTHAYERAKDQAHVDAKVPIAEEAKKIGINTEEHLYDHKFIPFDDGDKADGFYPSDKIPLDIGKHLLESKPVFKGEVKHAIHKDKTFHDDAFGHEFAKDEGKLIHDSIGHAEDELFKAKGSHGIGIALHDEHIKKSIQTDEHLLHGIHTGTDIHPVVKTDEVADKEVHHGKAHRLRSKFLSLIGKALEMTKCHLVTMRPAELLGIVNCISLSKNPLLCEKFAMCEKKKPLRVNLAFEKCQKEIIPGDIKRCTAYEPLFPGRDVPVAIFKCVAKSIPELSPVEKKEMIDFEECARLVKAEGCGRFPLG